jgi:ubiquinone/menaquinone biosynthesis C-methylase UbiE
MVGEGNHNDVVRQQFAVQASRFEPYVVSQGNRDVMSWILENLELQPNFAVLDVAAGTGLVGRKIAPYVRRVVALDATPAMLAQGRNHAEAEGLKNIIFEEGDAQHLPHGDASFDLVTCRIAIHHFQGPWEQAKEMARVCRPAGQVVIIDITTSENPEVASLHNTLERLRDPSHTRALTAGELRTLVEGSGLEIVRSSVFKSERTVEDWMDLTYTPPQSRQAIISQLEVELAGGPTTGMHPFLKDDQLMFWHSWVMLVGQRPQGNLTI